MQRNTSIIFPSSVGSVSIVVEALEQIKNPMYIEATQPTTKLIVRPKGILAYA